MRTLPVLLTKPEILLLGGGSVALRKARVLTENAIPFSVIAETLHDEILKLEVPVSQKKVEASDLACAHIIVDATGNPDVAALVLEEKRERNILLNCVAQPEIGNFHFSSLLNRGKLKIAVSTDGCSPAAGSAIRDRIASVLPENLDEFLMEKKGERELGSVDALKVKSECNQALSTVYLIGCGPGSVDLLTLKAYRTIQEMEVVLYDHLVTPEILDLVPASAQKIPVGKQKGEHSYRQEDINELLFEMTKRGLKIGRLKSGDPYIFGRGAEEAKYLVERGVRVEVISGISSAISGPACAGIPPTARGYATNLSIVSAHLAGNKVNTDWLPLLKIPDHTTVILMGLSFAPQISEMALQSGVRRDLPVAIISNASRCNQRIIVTDLEHLPARAKKAERPAILVLGDVVKLHESLHLP